MSGDQLSRRHWYVAVYMILPFSRGSRVGGLAGHVSLETYEAKYIEGPMDNL